MTGENGNEKINFSDSGGNAAADISCLQRHHKFFCTGRFLRLGGVFPAAIGNAYPEHGDSRKADDGNRRGVRAL